MEIVTAIELFFVFFSTKPCTDSGESSQTNNKNSTGRMFKANNIFARSFVCVISDLIRSILKFFPFFSANENGRVTKTMNQILRLF